MQAKSDGDGLYEALRSELRGVISVEDLPLPLRTKDGFCDWCCNDLGLDPDDVFPVDQMEDVEALFEGRVSIQVNSSVSSSDASASLRLSLLFDSKRYASSYEPKTSPRFEGLQGLEFWFRTLSLVLPKDHDAVTSNVAIFVVGTHADMADCFVDDRKHLIERVARDIGIRCQLHIHEVSCVTGAGIGAFREDLLRTSRAMPHMGERIPTVYDQIYEEIDKFSKELTEQASWCIT
jgi:hypothetical protein